MEREVLSSSPWHPATGRESSKLHQGRFRLAIGKPFVTERVVRHCSRRPREVGDAPCLSVP